MRDATRTMWLILVALACGCSSEGPGPTGTELTITFGGDRQETVAFNQLYCMEIKNVSDPALMAYMVRYGKEGQGYPGLQGNLRKASAAVGTHAPPQADTDITLNFTAGDVYVTGTAFRMTISEHTAGKSMSGKMEVLDGTLKDLATKSRTLTISPTTIDFHCPCVHNADAPATPPCLPQRL